jgi:branched-chain amino acid transport system substrate-binding protein
MKRIIGWSGLFVLLFAVPLWAGEKEILIGVAAPMTGDQSKIGRDIERGTRLAVEEWNAKGGIGGKKIGLEVGDDQHDPKQANAVAHKMVNAGILGMVGHFNSSASIPASSVYHDADIPMITPGSTNPQLTEQGFWNVFRVCGRDDQQGKVAADFMIQSLKAKRVAILHDKTTYGQGLASEVKKNLAGVEVVSYSGITQGDKDFRGVLTSLKEKKPDALFFGGIYPEGGVIAKQAKEIGLTVPLVGGDGMFDPELIKVAGSAAEGSTYLTFIPDPASLPNAQRFLTHYAAKHGKELAAFSIYGYDAANVLLTAIFQAKSNDGKAIAEALRKIKYDGASGHIEFDARGDIKAAPYVVWVAKGGKFEEFWKPK